MLRQTDPRVVLCFCFKQQNEKKRHKTKVGKIGSISVRRLLPRGIDIPSCTLKLLLKIHFRQKKTKSEAFFPIEIKMGSLKQQNRNIMAICIISCHLFLSLICVLTFPGFAGASNGIWLRQELQHQCTGAEQRNATESMNSHNCVERGPRGRHELCLELL